MNVCSLVETLDANQFTHVAVKVESLFEGRAITQLSSLISNQVCLQFSLHPPWSLFPPSLLSLADVLFLCLLGVGPISSLFCSFFFEY